MRARLRFLRDGRLLKTSRLLDLVAHRRGFRVWDALRGGPEGLTPGLYRVEVWTGEGQLVGRGDIRITAESVKAAS